MSATTPLINSATADNKIDIVAEIVAAANAKPKKTKEPKEKKPKEPKEKKTKEPKEPKVPKEKKTKEPREKKTKEPKEPKDESENQIETNTANNFKKKTISELKEYCKTHNISISGKTKKDDIIQTILTTLEAPSVPVHVVIEETKPYNKMNVVELKNLCKEKNIKINAKMKKNEIIGLLDTHDQSTSAVNIISDVAPIMSVDETIPDSACVSASLQNDTILEEYNTFMKKCIWNLLVGNTRSSKDFHGNKKAIRFDMFIAKYNGSFDKMIHDITRESYTKILEAINEFKNENDNGENEDYDEDSFYDLISKLADLSFKSLNGIDNLHIDNADDIRDEIKLIFFKDH